MKSKNLLICVTGLTPQIVTETLFCLSVQKKVRVDEIYVLTTQRGKDVILGKDEHPATTKSPLKKEIIAMCKKYKIRKPAFDENDNHIIVAKEESIELSDIRSDKDNILFPNKVCDFVRQKTSDPNTILYCSITGGRKSMSVHIANALSIFARENDKLLHVLTKEEHEFKGFYPMNKQEVKDLVLAEIPFVKMRPLLNADLKMPALLKSNFDEIVKITQAQLKLLAPQNKLILDIERRELRFGNNTVNLEPMLFLFYYFFVDSKERGKSNISVFEFLSEETKNQFLEYFAEFYPTRYVKEQKWTKKNFSAEIFHQRRSKVNEKIDTLIDDKEIAEMFRINVNKKYPESTYFIKADKDKFKIKS